MARPEDCPARRDWLDDEELSRHDRFTVEAAQRRFLLSHCFVRDVLSRYVPEVGETAWRFDRGERGRPEIAGDFQNRIKATQGLRFNLSHTENLYALIVTQDHDCGVDVETVTRTTDLVGVGRRSFAASEFREFLALEGQARRERFFEYWTLKESYVKAIGNGLATPLRDFWFDLDQEPIGVSFAEDLLDDAAQWSFGLHRPTSSNQVAWAISKATPPEPGLAPQSEVSAPQILWYSPGRD